ncbi:MAG TPA: hypothetical protein O0X39_02440 [Methanocorpusculum sp.]|nr:hypothetical protein [Methanocorpusculum sp.]
MTDEEKKGSVSSVRIIDENGCEQEIKVYTPTWDEVLREREKKLAEMRRQGRDGCLYGCPAAKEIVSASHTRNTEILDYE